MVRKRPPGSNQPLNGLCCRYYRGMLRGDSHFVVALHLRTAGWATPSIVGPSGRSPIRPWLITNRLVNWLIARSAFLHHFSDRKGFYFVPVGWRVGS